MKENTAELLKEVQKKIAILSILSMPGALMLGAGLLGKFGEDASSVHPMLNDVGTVNIVLVVGIIVTLWCGFKLWPLEREKVRLKKSM
ncbi:MAG: hypothetical protein ACI9XK_003669 [Granulosicoccus sp.]|jgi:hypothetical protein